MTHFSPKFPFHRNQPFELHCKSKTWFLYNDITRLKQINLVFKIACIHSALVIYFLIFAKNVFIINTIMHLGLFENTWRVAKWVKALQSESEGSGSSATKCLVRLRDPTSDVFSSFCMILFILMLFCSLDEISSMKFFHYGYIFFV